ncbi:MAG: GDP-mannose pyrophosphatase NudK [Bacteroidetes bacterium]|nr:GDP-mannose pyrophosphatase NudK [Bacteroidota bacterium]
MASNVKVLKEEVLSDSWYTLKKYTIEITKHDGSRSQLVREAYDRGNGAVILLYNRNKGTIILTRQFRLPTFLNGSKDGMLIEACAGLLDNEHPEDAIVRETQEETGFRIKEVKRVMEVYMSPGSVTELLYFFVAQYESSEKTDAGGGVDGEDIEVLELPFQKAMDMISTGEIKDAKTIMLLYHAAIKKLMN